MINEIELLIAPGPSAGEYDVRVIRAASGGTPREATSLNVPRLLRQRPTLEQAVLASAAHARSGPVPEAEQPLRDAGQELFEGLFVGTVRETYRASEAVARDRGCKLRVVLHLEAAELAALPWEALWDPEEQAYLCRKEPLVRHVPSPYTPDPLPVTPPLRILGLVASPRGLPPIDVERERQHVEEALAGAIADGRISIDWLEEASWDALQDRLLAGTWHVLHFIGHGDYDPVLDQGRIALVAEEDGRADWVEAGRLVDLLNEADPTPRLVVLNSCSSGQSGTQDVLSGTASALVHSGISAVAAMQFRISDPAAVAFPRGFYRALAAGKSVDAALSSGRIAILGRGESLEWVTPVLYMRGGGSQLFSWEPQSAVSSRSAAESGEPVRGATGEQGRGLSVAAAAVPSSAGTSTGELPRALTGDPRYRQAMQAYQNGDWDRVIMLLSFAAAEHPGVEIPQLARAQRKRDLAAWWAQEEAGTAGQGAHGTGTPSGTTDGERLSEDHASAAASGPVAASEAGPPGDAGDATLSNGPLAQPVTTVAATTGSAPPPEVHRQPRRRAIAIAVGVLVLILGIGGAWLLSDGGGQDSTGSGASPKPSAPARTSPEPPPPEAVPNTSAYSLADQDFLLGLGESRTFDFWVQNGASTPGSVGATSGGTMTVSVAGPQIRITGGESQGSPATGCSEPDRSGASITCTFGSLDVGDTAKFLITFEAQQQGTTVVTSSTKPNDGPKGTGDERQFVVEDGGSIDCFVPNLVGMSRSAAEQALQEAGLEPAPNDVEGGTQVDLVYNQDPPADTRVQCGSPVTFDYWAGLQ